MTRSSLVSTNPSRSPSLPEVSTDALRDAIRNLHGCESRFVESVPVTETFNGEIVWDGAVQVFDLIDHLPATLAYAWSHAVEGSENRRFVVVLHVGPVDSPQKAVQAAVVGQFRGDH